MERIAPTGLIGRLHSVVGDQYISRVRYLSPMTLTATTLQTLSECLVYRKCWSLSLITELTQPGSIRCKNNADARKQVE